MEMKNGDIVYFEDGHLRIFRDGKIFYDNVMPEPAWKAISAGPVLVAALEKILAMVNVVAANKTGQAVAKLAQDALRVAGF